MAAQTELLFTALVVMIAYLIRGLSGFGSGLIAVPVLALHHPLPLVVPVILTLDFVASFILGGANRKEADWGEIRRLVPFGAIGALLGVFALLRFPPAPVLIALAAFVIFFGMRNVLGVKPEGEVSSAWAVPAGLVGSGAGALFGTSAPPYVIYLTHRLADKASVRATFSCLFIIDGGFRLALLVGAGLLWKEQVQSAILWSMLPMMAGLYLGNRVHLGISNATMLKIIGVVLVVNGIMLIAKVLL
ncbi:MAG: sulfite exporter TauE/SafE family protein [Burkholderiales bacterium]